jgi:hypothetical protein
MELVTKVQPSQLEGYTSEGYPDPGLDVIRYIRKRYGQDNPKQLLDRHQREAILRYCKPAYRKEVRRILHDNEHAKCLNAPGFARPGRAAISVGQLEDNLNLFLTPDVPQKRFMDAYQRSLDSVLDDLMLITKGDHLKPISLMAVSESDSIKRGLSSNAGWIGFLTGCRTKRENLSLALEWCQNYMHDIAIGGDYHLYVVPSHRSSNSKIVDSNSWKLKCRIVLMQDLRGELLDGRFAIPFNNVFMKCPWGEGSMSHSDVDLWIRQARFDLDKWYSTDYSKFDTSQPKWLLEDIFSKIIRPMFGDLSEEDDQLFKAMTHSYINKKIIWKDQIYSVSKGNFSGSLLTYAINTILNEVVDRTSLLIQGVDLNARRSLKCGDDNITYLKDSEPFNLEVHARIIHRLFGISVSTEKSSLGKAGNDPEFLSRVWTLDGAQRDIREVLWNLEFSERFRDYSEEKTHVPERVAEALLLMCVWREEPSTARKYFDMHMVEVDSQLNGRRSDYNIYGKLASMGSGWNTPWIRTKLGELSHVA